MPYIVPKDPAKSYLWERINNDAMPPSGATYRIRLCNTSEYEIAVSITIDGLDAFEFFEPSKGRPAYYLVAPGKERVVKGWKIDTKGTKRPSSAASNTAPRRSSTS